MATLVKFQGNAVFNGGVKFQVTGIDTPLTPSLSSITSSGFTLSWDQVQDAFEYQLDISTNSNFSSFVAGYNNTTVPTTSAVVTGLSPQTTYWARIRAVVASTNSASVSGTTLEATSTLTNGLLAFYKLSDLTDSSGNNRTLTNNGGVTFSAGKIGNAAVFDGSNYLSNASVFTGETAVSYFCWGKIISFSGSDSSYGMAGVPSSGSWLLFYRSSVSQLRVGMNVVGYGWGDRASVSTSISQNEWVHVGFTYNGSNVKIYKNGSMISTTAVTGNFTNSLNDIYIGKEASWNSQVFNGQIDAVGIWNRALTDAEVAELYNAGNGLEIN